jgi:hypothetical protein
MQSGIRIEVNLITQELLPETSRCGFEYPGLDLLVGVAWLAEYMAASGCEIRVSRTDFDSSFILSTRLGAPALVWEGI